MSADTVALAFVLGFCCAVLLQRCLFHAAELRVRAATAAERAASTPGWRL